MDEEQTTGLRFDDLTRNLIMNKYIDERIKVLPDPQKWIDHGGHLREAESFVSCLERMAAIPYSPLENQKKRKEKIEAFSNALFDLIEYGLKADDSSIAYVIGCGLTEAYAQSECSDLDRSEVAWFNSGCIQEMVYDLQHKYKPMLSAFELGVRKSIKDLPALDKSYINEHKTAAWIEDYLGRMNIPFSTSDTGLAGTAFLATMELMGNDVQRAQYWLKKAKDGDSWVSFIKRMRDGQKIDAE